MKATAKAKRIVADPHSCRFLIQPRDGAAVVQIGATVYLVREGYAAGGERWWQFYRDNGLRWTVHVRGPESMICDCPDRLFRRRECKHGRCIRVLYGVPFAAQIKDASNG